MPASASSAHVQPENGVASPLAQQQLLFIDGNYRNSSDGATFTVRNPMTGESIYTCASASIDDYSSAIDSAHAAFQSWSTTSPSTRRLIFLKAADILETYLHEDAPEILSAEVSATKGWVKLNIHATVGTFREVAGLVTHIKGEIVPADRPGTTILVERRAVGVVLAISPWNAPVNLTARAIACPLVCGNTIVLKPSEFSPKSQHLVVRALTAAGLPPGCLNFLPSSPDRTPAVTEFAVKHPKVRRVNFTGSDRVGRIIAGWAATCLKQCVLELGGKAPVVVLEDADIDAAAEAVVFGAFANAGQICMSTERVIVHRSIADAFCTTLLDKVSRLKSGNIFADPDVSISGLITPGAAERVLGLLQRALDGGAKLLAGNLKITGPKGTILAPHVLADVPRDADLHRQESFGPVLIMSTFETEQEAIAAANDSEFSLCASVFSRDVLRALDVARQMRAGSTHINGPTVYVEATLPNGGTGGSSGYGRFGGMAGVEEFTERQILTLAKPGLQYHF